MLTLKTKGELYLKPEDCFVGKIYEIVDSTIPSQVGELVIRSSSHPGVKFFSLSRDTDWDNLNQNWKLRELKKGEVLIVS